MKKGRAGLRHLGQVFLAELVRGGEQHPVKPQDTLRVGDRIHIKGHTTDFGQRVDSLQVEHQPVMEVGPSDDFGIKVIDHAREHDVVYKL